MGSTHKYPCTGEFGAEVLIVIASFIIVANAMYGVLRDGIFVLKTRRKSSDKINIGIFLSAAYTILLPLMSYIFSQAEKNNSKVRGQIVLVWIVLVEVIRVRDGNATWDTWELRKTAEQVMRLIWVGYLVYGYKPLNGLRLGLFFLCAYSITWEVMKGIVFHKANNSYLIGGNPKLIQNYMKRLIREDDLRTTPLNSCGYIVMGEENHEIAVCEDGYCLGDKKSTSKVEKLTIGRVFRLNSSEDEEFTLEHPNWRDNCLSLAMAKMLRRRFVNQPIHEAGCSKAYEFVLKGLIDYIGSNGDIPSERRNGARNPSERNQVASSKKRKLFVRLKSIINMKKDDSIVNNVTQARIHYSIFDATAHAAFCAPLLQWIRRKMGTAFPTISHSTDVKETILMSLKKTNGKLSKGETALKNHGIWEHLNLVYQPSKSITETILVWHIATSLFHHEKHPPRKNYQTFFDKYRNVFSASIRYRLMPEIFFRHQEPSPQQNNDPFKEKREVALALSSYCHYLVAFLPRLLPDEVEWTEDMYKRVKKEIFAIDRYSGQKPTIATRCNYAMHVGITWNEKSVVKMGAALSKELMRLELDEGKEVWKILSEFWAEMVLFIAPSDNVKGHEEILEKQELITQLWALLTHAGILTRPEFTQHSSHGIHSNEVTEDINV
ncbi:hypothetical protein LUZ62_064322 [Rhynchospora pubera]|uniref:DUF4220 domain-containing protein n=1 Tax=Rhynchospora pubera TaxID=906938 RepID=A0AAV8EF50_9POAL|nr:hypothetical protein LUZ62_064322 [Rhynchospora pubera]